MNSNIKVVRSNGFEYIQFNRLLEFAELKHAYTIKNNNIGFNKLQPETTKKSYNTLCKEFNINENDIIQLYQDHTKEILEIKEKNDIINTETNIVQSLGTSYEKMLHYDGIITNCENVGTIITTADCMPLMFYDPINKLFANIHSGWKGTVKQIGIKAVEKMIKEYNSKPENIICCIAPCIHKNNFLVNEDVRNIYINEIGEQCKKYNIIEETDLENEKGKQYRIDNIKLYAELLKEIGLIEKNIIDSEICTVESHDLFHSRRMEGENYNVNANFMMLENR